MKKLIYVLVSVMISFMLWGCTERAIDKSSVQILNSSLVATDKIKALDTVMLTMSNLKPNQAYQIQIKNAAGMLISKVKYCSDENGNIAPEPIWYQAGLNNRGVDAGKINPQALLQSYTVYITGAGTDITLPFTIFNGSNGATLPPVVAAAMVTGNSDYFITDSFDYDSITPANSKDVYVWAQNLPAGVNTVNVYVIDDKDIKDGYDINQFPVVSSSVVAVSPTGSIFAKVLAKEAYPALAAAQKTNFDIIVDINKNGVYDEGIDIVDGKLNVGFSVQKLAVPVVDDIIRIQIASKGFNENNGDYGYSDTYRKDGSDLVGPYWATGDWGNYYKGIKAIFNSYVKKSWHWNDYGADVDAAFIAPYSGMWVNVYVVTANASIYGDNSAITQINRVHMADVSGQWGAPQVETIPLAASCYNGASQFIIYPKAYLRPGNYSVVVDINNNGQWDSDVDFIDDIKVNSGVRDESSHIGFTITTANAN